MCSGAIPEARFKNQISGGSLALPMSANCIKTFPTKSPQPLEKNCIRFVNHVKLPVH